MEDKRKTKKQLIEELNAMRQSVEELKCFAEEVKQSKINQEKFTKAFLQNSIPAVITTLKEGRIVEVSNAFLRLVELKRDEVVGYTSREIGYITEEQRASFVGELNKSGCIEDLEMEIKAKNGELRYGLFNAVMMNFNHEKYFLTAIQDITERKRMEQLTEESEQKFSLAFNTSPIPTAISAIQDGRFLVVNDAFIEIFSFASKTELIGKKSVELGLFANPSDRQSVRKDVEETGSVHNRELKMVTKDGRTLDILFSAVPVLVGNKQCLITSAVDITERKHAEERLRESEEKYRALIDKVNEGIIIAQGGVFVLTNHRLSEMLGVPAGELKGKPFIDFVWPEDREMVMKNYGNRIAGEEIDDGFDFRIIGAQGNLTWVFLSAALIMWEGKPATLNLVTDITERKQAEEAQAFLLYCGLPATGEDFFESLARYLAKNTGMDYVCIDRLEGDGLTAQTVAVYNEGVFECNVNYALKDTPCGEVVGKGVCCYPRDVRHLFPRDQALQELKAESYYGTTLVDSKGQQIGLIAVIGHHVLDDPKSIESLLKLVAPRAAGELERRKAEEDREKLQAQLIQAQKMESVGRLAGGVAHDFNNMLGVILGHTEMALERVDPAQPLYEDLQEIQKAANRSADLTRQLLAFARKQTISPRVLDLNDTVEGMIKMLQRLIGEDIDLSWMPQDCLWPVKMDPSQIDQILANLCVNARDAISGVGKVTIETATTTFDEDYCAEHASFVPGDYILLSVSDDGCGMDKETQIRLFEPFFTTKSMGKGTGLGLATVYGIVKQNNGFIYVYTEPGQGTTFKIYLPRYVGKGEQIQKKGSANTAAIGHETILLAEDEPTIMNMTKRMLEKLGYLVLAAATPGEAIQLADQHSGEIHLLLTDVVMPEMNGRDLARKLLSLYPDLRRLFMSGYTANVIAHHGVLDDGVHFIQKPFSMKDLGAKVREALDCH